MGEEWRTEADDQWLNKHRSDSFARLRKRFRMAGGLANAMSNAELGPFGGAPRNPQLKIGGRKYSTIRYATHYLAYTTIHLFQQRCPRCGAEVEAHRVIFVRENGSRTVVGTLRMCRGCQANSWLFHSRMPATVRARTWARKVVL
jgi:hypothetical protein